MKIKLTLFMALAGLLTPSAGAQDAPTRPGRGEGGRALVSPEELKQYDKDGDGRLNEEERNARRAGREKEMLAKYDADKDGKLNADEQKKMESEIPRGRGGPGGSLAPGGRFQPTAEDIKKYDADGDGQLNQNERRTWGEGRRKEMLAKYDADKDGQLNDEERAKMMEEFRRPRETSPEAPAKPDEKKPEEKKSGEKKPEATKIPVPETK